MLLNCCNFVQYFENQGKTMFALIMSDECLFKILISED